MWIYVDKEQRVHAYNPNDMGGNSGWHKTQSELFAPQNDAADSDGNSQEQAPEIIVELQDSRGIPMYRYDPDADIIIKRTAEEMDADYVEPVPTPSDADRITALENQLAAYESAYQEGVNEA